MLGGDESLLDGKQVLGLVGHGDDVAGLDAIRRNVKTLAVHGDVAVTDGLTGLLAGAGEAEAEHDVVETELEKSHQVVAGDAVHLLGLVVVATELLLEHAVDELGLLLLAQLHAVLALLATACGLTLRFLGGIAQHHWINAQLAAALQNRSPVNCHNLNPPVYELDATTLARTATVVRDGRAILDAGNFQPCCLQRTDGGLAAGAGTLHEHGDLVQAVLHGRLRSGLGGHLRGKRGGFTGALETDRAGGLPGNDVALRVGDRDNGVVERRLDVRGADCDVLTLGALHARGDFFLLCHV